MVSGAPGAVQTPKIDDLWVPAKIGFHEDIDTKLGLVHSTIVHLSACILSSGFETAPDRASHAELVKAEQHDVDGDTLGIRS